VATVGVIVKELGAFWAIFSTGWSVVMAYTVAVICFQLGNLSADPAAALTWIGIVAVIAATAMIGLIRYGQYQLKPLIPVIQLD
jgi:hypothetical protein